MNTHPCHLRALLLTLLFTAGAAAAARDPFWPIGYTPPAPAAATPTVATRPEPPPKPVEKSITDADWAAARKALVISGFTHSVRPDTGETRTHAMVNRRMVVVGDTVALVHQDVRFLWRVKDIAGQTIQFEPLSAERQPPKAVELKSSDDLKENR